MKKMIFLMAFFILLANSYCFAEKKEWVDKTYNFSNVTRVMFFGPNIASEINNGINEKEIIETFNTKINLQKVEIVPFEELIIGMKANGIDMPELAKSKPMEFDKLLFENIYKYTDVIIVSSVSKYGIESRYKAPLSYNTTSYETSYINTQNGSATVQTPVTKTHTLPGGYYNVACVLVRWDLTDAKTRKTILTRIDNEQANHSKNTNKVYTKIVDSFSDDFNKLIKHKN